MIKKIFDAVSDFIEKNKISGAIIAIGAFLIVLAFSFTATYEIFELKLYDIRFMVKPPVREWDRLTFVDIDENSITNIGQFPWPRQLYGTGARALRSLDVESLAFDIMFPDHSPAHLDNEKYLYLYNKLSKNTRLTPADLDAIVLDNDRMFARGIGEHGRVILSYTFNNEVPPENVKERLSMPDYVKAIAQFTRKGSTIPDPAAGRDYSSLIDDRTLSISYPIPELMESGHLFGFVNRYTDPDGTVRKVKLVQFFEGRLYFNLALVMLMDACGVPISDVAVAPGKGITLKNAFNPLRGETGDLFIPIDREGMMFVNWAGKPSREESFYLVPFYALLDYAAYAPAVHDYFIRTEESRGLNVLSGIEAAIAREKNLYARARTAEEKNTRWKALTALRDELKKTRDSYTTILADELDRITEQFKKTGDRALKDEIEIMKDDLNAINLVSRLEHDLAGDITISGLTATGTHDIGIIPLSNEYARVGVYHNTVNTIINGSYISKAGPAVNYLFMFAIAMIMGLAIQRMSARLSMATIGISFVAVNVIAVLSFAFMNYWIDQLGLSLALILPSLTIAGVKFLREENQKRFIKNAFSHYLAPNVIEKIIQNPDSLKLGGESREITIFFSDVAKFSALSEKLSPTELVARLNEYLSEMTDIILAHGGTVDKYEGDAIMAFFGAPQSFEDHALRCCLASIDQKKRLRELQEGWRLRGVDELHVRMGMNSGVAVVGNMGSRSRMDYTVMGDSVNLASRLEGANKYYGTSAMISQSTYNAAKDDIEARKLDVVRVVGKQEAIAIYELLGRRGTLPQRMYDMLHFYYNALSFFESRQWKRALAQFQAALNIIEDDGPSLAYVKRCEEFIKKPPSKKWDGIFSFKSK
jgi:adenylate cyclase